MDARPAPVPGQVDEHGIGERLAGQARAGGAEGDGDPLGRSRPQQPGHFGLGCGLDHDFRYEAVKARVIAQGKVVEGAEKDPVGRDAGGDAVVKGAVGRGQGGKRGGVRHGVLLETRRRRGVRMVAPVCHGQGGWAMRQIKNGRHAFHRNARYHFFGHPQ